VEESDRGLFLGNHSRFFLKGPQLGKPIFEVRFENKNSGVQSATVNFTSAFIFMVKTNFLHQEFKTNIQISILTASVLSFQHSFHTATQMAASKAPSEG
jgi:hypothetical protein